MSARDAAQRTHKSCTENHPGLQHWWQEYWDAQIGYMLSFCFWVCNSCYMKEEKALCNLWSLGSNSQFETGARCRTCCVEQGWIEWLTFSDVYLHNCWNWCLELKCIKLEDVYSWSEQEVACIIDDANFPFQGTGAASFDEFGNSKYQNRRTMSSSDRAMMNAFKEITNMADRINLPRNIVVSSCLLSLNCSGTDLVSII